MAISLPSEVRQLLDAPNYVHLSTLRAGGSPRNWVVWVGLEDDHMGQPISARDVPGWM